MARRFAAAVAITAGLLLGGCGADYGVDQHGKAVEASQVDGHWVILNYWAEWCGPCRLEVPELNTAAQRWQASGVKVIGVNFDGLQGDELKQASETLGIRFTVLAQDPAEHYDLPRSEALPVTYIIDDKGKVREQLVGEQTLESLKARLKALKGPEV
ncbi:TlpA family protein disulfide reductase [Enterobacterales bacterium AW_CKDN230030176-1A_HGKHYDSX7]